MLIAAFAVHALRVDVPADGPAAVPRTAPSRSASLTSVVVGAVLFGAMFVLPLYYQVVRGYSALEAGLLLAPQGLGAMIAMPIGGRHRRPRPAPGASCRSGIVAIAVGTLAYTQVTPTRASRSWPPRCSSAGIGMGFVMMPAMAAAYINLSRAEVPRATTMVNIMQRVGGSLGTALFAVVLERQIIRRTSPARRGRLDSTGGLGGGHARSPAIIAERLRDHLLVGRRVDGARPHPGAVPAAAGRRGRRRSPPQQGTDAERDPELEAELDVDIKAGAIDDLTDGHAARRRRRTAVTPPAGSSRSCDTPH